MNFGVLLYIIVLVAIIYVLILMGKKKKYPRSSYTGENKKGLSLTQIDKMLANIKEPIKIEQNTEVHEQKEIEHEKHTTEKVEKKEHNKFDAKTAIIYSSIIQRKKFKH